jgi:hypothetical protein
MKHQELIDRGMIDPSNPDIVHIGKETVIGENTRIITHCVHRMYNRNPKIFIGDYVWIGFGCIVLPGVAIGHGSVIGAGSVVTKDCPEFSVMAGNPAKVIRKRKPYELLNYVANRKNQKRQGVVWPDWSCLTKQDVYDVLKSPYDWFEISNIFCFEQGIGTRDKFDFLEEDQFMALIHKYRETIRK